MRSIIFTLVPITRASSKDRDAGGERLGGERVAELVRDVPLEVHHVNGDPMDNRIVNTIPLCRDCHHKATFPGI